VQENGEREQKLFCDTTIRNRLFSDERALGIATTQIFTKRLRRTRLPYKRFFGEVDDDSIPEDLSACMMDMPLDRVIQKHQHLYVIPWYWTSCHERVLHVTWHPFQPLPQPLSRLSSSPSYFQLPDERMDKHGRIYGVSHLGLRNAVLMLSTQGNHYPRGLTKNHIPSQGFLQFQLEFLTIKYGPHSCPLATKVHVFRLITASTMDIGLAINNDHRPGFWRMIYLDGFDIQAWSDKYKRFARNLKLYGDVDYVCDDPFGSWRHPHFIPGVFIAMAQRYEKAKWYGQRKELLVGKGAPTWQILISNRRADFVNAHLYTAQVPKFFLDCFNEPGRIHRPAEADRAETRNVDARQRNDASEGGQPDFLIRHTPVAHSPVETFLYRLRQAIILSRDFGELGTATGTTGSGQGEPISGNQTSTAA
jgi:hypothetical protein